MERREILKISAVILSYSLSGAATAALLGGCKVDISEDWSSSVLDNKTLELVREVAGRIIPKTDTPGAKEAKVERYIDMALKNNYTDDARDQFIKELKQFDQIAETEFQSSFSACTDEEKDLVLSIMWENRSDIFQEVKSLVVTGFLTSEEGATMAMKYDPVPGEFIACMDLSDVGGRWAY